ncbi:cysteine dioxygenase [Streptomyces sp. DSM 42041]|uniref:Cysteine dioxygenase n=1 Tax=Streptomyces hazeniae TaxID=3075538 RepID=A0ABU2NRB3_9ACTN|nr:cysteine dioxygenase [Streptomyces sp. DSM 42041]MDT0379515.1 cysteine dioxygenase [Streptomyces sp. DSM 42041]
MLASPTQSRPDPDPAAPGASPRRRLLARAAELARDPAVRPQLHLEADVRTWARIDGPDGCEAWLVGWPPGTATGWHDHGGASGAFTVLEGLLEEHTPAAEPSRETDTVRLPPGGPHRRALTPGAGRAFGPHHVHDVLSTGTVHAVSLHLYAPALPSMRRFAAHGGLLRLVDVEHPGAWT